MDSSLSGEKSNQEKQKKRVSCKTEDLPFRQKRQKLAIKKRKNSSYTCFFRKRDSTASWVADAIWPQHFEDQ